MQSINTEEDARKFIDGIYDGEAIEYLYQIDYNHYNEEERVHVLKCLKSIIAHLFKLAPAGDFGQAIIRNVLETQSV